MKKIYIDVGHGGADSGAVKGSRQEKDDVLRLALLIREELLGQDVLVKLSRLDDKVVPTLNGRTADANAWGADYFLSLHRNSATASATGNEIWVYSKANQGTVLAARAILEAVLAVDGLKDRGVKKGAALYTDFAVNRDTFMASSLLELGFISNENDNRVFDGHVNEYARVLARALCQVVGVEYKENQLYRVRRSWSDASSQLGAFRSFENAKDAAKPSYGVFDSEGRLVYERPIIIGDVNGDGKVTAADARLALRAAARLARLEDWQMEAADVNGDGKVTAADARAILRMSARLD